MKNSTIFILMFAVLVGLVGFFLGLIDHWYGPAPLTPVVTIYGQVREVSAFDCDGNGELQVRVWQNHYNYMLRVRIIGPGAFWHTDRTVAKTETTFNLKMIRDVDDLFGKKVEIRGNMVEDKFYRRLIARTVTEL